MTKNANIKVFKKHVNIIGVICAVVITLITNYVLSLVLSNIRNDIMWTTLTTILSYFQDALIFVAGYVLYGLLINSLLRFGFRGSRGILNLSCIRLLLIYMAYLVFGIFMSRDFINDLKANMLYILLNFSVDIVLLIGVIILVVFLRSKFIDLKKTNITVKSIFDRKNPIVTVTLWVSILITAVYLAGCVAETYALIMTYGADNLNFREVITLVSPYLEQVFRFIVGYLIMMGTAKWLELQWTLINTADKNANK